MLAARNAILDCSCKTGPRFGRSFKAVLRRGIMRDSRIWLKTSSNKRSRRMRTRRRRQSRPRGSEWRGGGGGGGGTVRNFLVLWGAPPPRPNPTETKKNFLTLLPPPPLFSITCHPSNFFCFFSQPP